MKITYAATKKLTYFCDLEPGTVFKVALDAQPLLKTMECKSSRCNAVNLVANDIIRIDPGAKVIPIDYEFIIK